MKLAIALVLLTLTPVSALADAPRCDNEALVNSVGKLRGGRSLKVTKADGEARLELMHGIAREVVLRVTCDGIEVPLADQLERPSKGSATRVVDGITLSRTATGAVSLDFAADMLDRESVQMLVLDDDSVSIVRGDKVFYAFATHSDGTTVEIEGVGNGCGCERVTAPDGTVTRRRLAR